MTQAAISKRKLLIGFCYAIFIVVIHLAVGAFEYFRALNEDYDITSNLIYIVAYNYFFVSILFLLKNILVDYYGQHFLSKKLYWIIKLQIIAAVLNILMALGLGKVLFAPFVVVAIIGVVFDMGLLLRHEIKFNYKFLQRTLQAIPFVFLGVFFYKTMKEVHG